jgi:hypothetical protein
VYTGRKVDVSSSPKQKMIKALVGFTQYQSVARKQAAVHSRPLGIFLHDLCVANGASRTLLNVLAGLCLMPWPHKMDKVTDALNKTEAEALHGVLNPDARASQQMVLGRRLTSFANVAGARASDGTSTGASASASAGASDGAAASASASASACASSASTDALGANASGGGGSGPASAVCLPAGVRKQRMPRGKSATGLHFPWISAVVHSFQPEWQGRAAYYTLDFAPLRIARLKVALPHPTKQVLFLPAVSAAIESDSLPPMPPLPNEPAAVWANIQRRTSAAARQGMAGLLLAALLPHPPPTESLSEDDLALVAEAHAAPGRQRDGLVKIWADHVPLTRDTFARLRPVPAHTQYEGARYHLNDEAVNSFLGLINRAGNGSHAFIFSSHLFTALEACADPTISTQSHGT